MTEEQQRTSNGTFGDRQHGEGLRVTATDTSTPATGDMAPSAVMSSILPPTNQRIFEPGVPRFEQWPAPSSYATSVTHAHTSAMGSMNEWKEESVIRGGNGSAPSMLSFLSTQDVSRFLRELHGRTFNSLNESYLLPSDDLEFERLDKQHAAFLIGFSGYYPAPEIVERILSPLPNEPRRVLDVGCGTGTWAIEMANRFPDVLILGIDVAPVPQDSSAFPPNLSFEIDDVNHGLSHYHNQFDLVRMCCVMSGLVDLRTTLVELQCCLKPGGMLLVIDGEWVYTEDRNKRVPLAKVEGDEDVDGISEDGNWFSRMFWEAICAANIAGAGMKEHELIDIGPWNGKFCDPAETVSGSLYLPLGPWAEGETPVETQMLRYTGILMRQDFLSIHRAYHSILLRHGMNQKTLDEWSGRIDEEFNSDQRLWVRFRFFWTRRREGEGLPAPPLPSSVSHKAATPPIRSEDGHLGSTHAASLADRSRAYPGLELYHTREEAMARLAARKASLGDLPTPAVERAWRRKRASETELSVTEGVS